MLALSYAMAAPALVPAPAFASVRPASRVAALAPRMAYDSKEAVISPSIIDVFSNPTEYKEQARQYRQDVYAFSDWRWHRESGHVADALPSVFTSGIGKALWREVAFVVLAAVGVLAYNEGLPAIAEMIDNDNIVDLLESRPLLHLSLLPLTLASPALFLLLVFRTNASYDRWWEARKIWGSLINTSRDHARQGIALLKDEQHRTELCAHTTSFNRVLKYHLTLPTAETEATLLAELKSNRMSDENIAVVMRATHKPMALLGLMAASIHDRQRTGLDSVQTSKLDQSLTLMTDYLGMCERIIKTPIPLVYTRHTARFLSWWLVWLPVCLYDQLPDHWTIVPVSSIIAFFLIGIEELGNQIEEPFSILPMTAMGTGICGSIFESLDRSLGVVEEEETKGVVVPFSMQSSNPNAFVR